MAGVHDQRQAVRSGFLLNQVGQLHDGLLLNLRASHDPFGQARVFRQPNHIGVFIGHDADPQLADDGAQMVRAGTAHGNGANQHQLIERFGVGKFGNHGLLHITPRKHLLEVHLGRAPCRVVGVMVVCGIDHQTVQHRLHFFRDLIQQGIQLAGLQKFGNVVVGMKTLARCQQALANFDGNRNPCLIVGLGRLKLLLFFHEASRKCHASCMRIQIIWQSGQSKFCHQWQMIR